MDWLRKIPIGQYVSGNRGWLVNLDPRHKFAWVLIFLLSPVLAGSYWRIGLVLSLIVVTVLSCLPIRVWWRSFCVALILGTIVGLLSMFFPTGEPSKALSIRFPQELQNTVVKKPSWYLIQIGPFKIGSIRKGPILINRRSAELGIKTSTLTFTVIHSVNLMLLTTPPEDLVWTIRWIFAPLRSIGFPIDRISFQLLLSLRFIPLIQEELQNLLRSVSTRSLNFRKLGFKATISLILSVGERLLSNILLRAEQGAEALQARGGRLLSSNSFIPNSVSQQSALALNLCSAFLLVLVITLRKKYGAL